MTRRESPYDEQLMRLRSLTKRFRSKVRFRSASSADMAYLHGLGYPSTVTAFYEKAEPSDIIDVNGARLYPVSEIRIENEDAIPGYVAIKLGYLNLGSTIVGDTYCVNSRQIGATESPIVLVSHDLVCEGASDEEIGGGVISIADSFRGFLDRFIAGDLPTDYWDLKESESGSDSSQQ